MCSHKCLAKVGLPKLRSGRLATFNEPAAALIAASLADHPDWEQFLAPYGPAEDPEAEPGSVRFAVPAPSEPGHRLEVAVRGNTIEVAYDCGDPRARAEGQFIFSPDTLDGAVAEVREFLQRFCAGQIGVVREQTGRSRFRYLAELKQHPQQYLAVHRW